MKLGFYHILPLILASMSKSLVTANETSSSLRGAAGESSSNSIGHHHDNRELKNNGNGNGNGNGNNHRPVDNGECEQIYNRGICQKMEKMLNDFTQFGLDFDLSEFQSVKQMMKDAKPAPGKKKEFKDAAIKVLNQNKGGNKDPKQLIEEVLDELSSQDLKDSLAFDVEFGTSEADLQATIDPHAGEEDEELDTPEDYGRALLARELGVTSTNRRWEGGIVKYYVIVENDWTGYWTWLDRILPAMNELEEITNLQFELQGGYYEYTTSLPTGFVYVRQRSSGCSAHVGAPTSTWRASINIGPRCSHGNILHELLHASGMTHQQNANYRDNYVTVNSNNIEPGREFNFEKITDTSNHGWEWVYDYGSIMHYGEYFFSVNGGKTIDCHGNRCGQRSALSYWDQWETIVYYDGYYFINNNL